MKKHLAKTILLSLFVIFTIPAFASAGTQHSLSVDMIRLVDKAQYDAMFNIYYQMSLNNRSALLAGISIGDDVTIGEAGYKFYLERYFDGPFGQVSINIGDYDGDTEFGLSGAVGYEKSIVRHLVLSCAVEVTAGSMDNYATGDNDPIFRPILSVVFAF